MKGVVFTEFFEMVEQSFSAETVERVIDGADLPNGGAYTTVGTYEAGEMVRLVQALSAESGLAVPDLLFAFGKYLLGRFATIHPEHFAEAGGTFRLLERVEDSIHIDVRKLDPAAELPSFAWDYAGEDKMILDYASPRGMAKLAEGLIAGAIEHYREPIEVQIETQAEDGTTARFVLERKAA